MTTNTPLYEIVDLKHRYNENFLLDIKHITIERGVSVGFFGPNGSGKSALLRNLAFLETPDEGVIYFNGVKVNKNNAVLKKDVTLLLQEPYLLKRSVFENVAYGVRVRGKTENLTEKVHEALQWVGLPPDKFAARRWFELSVGEAQRVALASRFVFRPKVLILDEPTANVDRHSASLIKTAISKVRKKYNTSLVIVSHDLIWLNDVTDEILRMYEGCIVGAGTDNLINGPWNRDKDGLWKRILSDGQKICATNPQDENAIAILNPSNIMISTEHPEGISAQNILKGIISHITSDRESGKVSIEINVSDMPLTCSVTRHAAETLHLLPGKDVWAVFKASSLYWH